MSLSTECAAAFLSLRYPSCNLVNVSQFSIDRILFWWPNSITPFPLNKFRILPWIRTNSQIFYLVPEYAHIKFYEYESALHQRWGTSEYWDLQHCHNLFHNNCLNSRALIGKFLSSLRSQQTNIILDNKSFPLHFVFFIVKDISTSIFYGCGTWFP